VDYRADVDSNTALITEIRRAISKADGKITFARFMELALYHPQHGYYTGLDAEGHETARLASAPYQRPDGGDLVGQAGPAPSGAGPVRRQRIGRAGDYFTSVSVGPLFGRILARQFQQFCAELGNPPEFEVVEFGGHRGQLRDDVLAAAPGLRYRVVEIGDSIPERIVGCIFSNEFLDAMPVHRVTVVNGEWRELYVGAQPAVVGAQHAVPLQANNLLEISGPLSDARLINNLKDLPVHLMEGYTTEVNLRALDWLENVTPRLQRGFVLTIDYGYEREAYFSPQHHEGTLLGYHLQTKNNNPYQHIGEQDITAHVEFSSFIEHGKTLDLEPVLFTDQSHYLLQTGEPIIAEIIERTAGQPSKERQAIHQLLHPELMGRTFKVLVQRKRI